MRTGKQRGLQFASSPFQMEGDVKRPSSSRFFPNNDTMSDSMIRNTGEILEEISEDPDGRLRSWLRERERLGALPEWHAALDDAFARGYARGTEDGNVERLDAARTILSRMLETKFGEIHDAAMDRIAEASQATLEKWMVALLSASSIDEALKE